MVEPFEHAYFNWLYAKVADVHETDPKLKYEKLFSIFHRHEFFWTVIGDDNRVEDALALRDDFMEMSGLTGEFEEECSVLELLISFARRAGQTSGLPTQFWFWTMVENLGLSEMTDAADPDENVIHTVLDVFVNRQYDELGRGGIFPLREAQHDQRFIELWYQFNEYSYQNNIA